MQPGNRFATRQIRGSSIFGPSHRLGLVVFACGAMASKKQAGVAKSSKKQEEDILVVKVRELWEAVISKPDPYVKDPGQHEQEHEGKKRKRPIPKPSKASKLVKHAFVAPTPKPHPRLGKPEPKRRPPRQPIMLAGNSSNSTAPGAAAATEAQNADMELRARYMEAYQQGIEAGRKLVNRNLDELNACVSVFLFLSGAHWACSGRNGCPSLPLARGPDMEFL